MAEVFPQREARAGGIMTALETVTSSLISVGDLRADTITFRDAGLSVTFKRDGSRRVRYVDRLGEDKGDYGVLTEAAERVRRDRVAAVEVLEQLRVAGVVHVPDLNLARRVGDYVAGDGPDDNSNFVANVHCSPSDESSTVSGGGK
jgi:hypothetical protein